MTDKTDLQMLVLAIEPFGSQDLQSQVSDLPDNTPVRIEIYAQNGAAVTITLAELRALWAAGDYFRALCSKEK